MIKSGIITKDKEIFMPDEEITNYLKKLLNNFNDSERQMFEAFKRTSVIQNEDCILHDFFVRFLGFIIIEDRVVYYPSEIIDINLNKEEYVRYGYALKKESKLYFINNKMVKKQPTQEDKLLNIIGFEHSSSPENDLSFWYEKTVNLGLRTPKTIIVPLSNDEFSRIKSQNISNEMKTEIFRRIMLYLTENNFSIDREMFIRLSNSSNKFNFETCYIRKIDELLPKLMQVFKDLYFKCEWLPTTDIIVREFIHPTYERKTIYNGMPLYTEFRVFYDFDTHELLGIFNYWERETMIDNLLQKEDLFTFVSEIDKIEKDFERLKDKLADEINKKLSNANLNGQWSIDFMYDGENFVLIDMAHAECSYYYDKLPKSKMKSLNLLK